MASPNQSIVARVLCRWLDFHCPLAKRNLVKAVASARFPPCNNEADHTEEVVSEECSDAKPLHLRLEAIGSGVLLLGDLEIEPTASVGDLKTLISLERTNTPAGQQRLFVGHGGVELLYDAAPLNTCLLSERVLTMMLVDFEFQLLVVALGGNIDHPARRSIISMVKVCVRHCCFSLALRYLGVAVVVVVVVYVVYVACVAVVLLTRSKPNQTIKSLREQGDFFSDCTYCVDPQGNILPNDRTLLSCNIGASGLFVTFTPAVTHLSFEVLQGGFNRIAYPDIEVRLPPDTPLQTVCFQSLRQVLIVMFFCRARRLILLLALKVKEIFCTQCRPDLQPDDVQLRVCGHHDNDNLFSLQDPSVGWLYRLQFHVVVP